MIDFSKYSRHTECEAELDRTSAVAFATVEEVVSTFSQDANLTQSQEFIAPNYDEITESRKAEAVARQAELDELDSASAHAFSRFGAPITHQLLDPAHEPEVVKPKPLVIQTA